MSDGVAAGVPSIHVVSNTHTLSHSDFPGVRFWTAKAWKKYQKDGKGFSNTPPIDGNAYLENSDGTPVDAERASSIRHVAIKLWFTLLKKSIHPPRWGEVTAEADEIYKNGMAKVLPEMQYCEDHWKATYLATHCYPSWYNNHVKKKAIIGIKLEPTAEDTEVATKKRQSEDIVVPSKRLKKSSLVKSSFVDYIKPAY